MLTCHTRVVRRALYPATLRLPILAVIHYLQLAITMGFFQLQDCVCGSRCHIWHRRVQSIPREVQVGNQASSGCYSTPGRRECAVPTYVRCRRVDLCILLTELQQ